MESIVGVAVLTSDRAEFKQKLVRKDKSHHILVKKTIHQEEITIINKCQWISVHPITQTTTGHKRTDRPWYNKTGWLHYPSLINK
jgi:hypothetical protein